MPLLPSARFFLACTPYFISAPTLTVSSSQSLPSVYLRLQHNSSSHSLIPLTPTLQLFLFFAPFDSNITTLLILRFLFTFNPNNTTQLLNFHFIHYHARIYKIQLEPTECRAP
jgi:hypothetical protein